MKNFYQMFFCIFFSVFVFTRIVDSTAFINLWHRWMNHLKSFRLHHLNNKYLGVKLKSLCMFQCVVCAKIKMTNQVFHRSLINRFIRFFYKVNIDWEDLNEKWNDYQSNKTIIKQVMKIVYQITNMMITYFILIQKKIENLLFIYSFFLL